MVTLKSKTEPAEKAAPDRGDVASKSTTEKNGGSKPDKNTKPERAGPGDSDKTSTDKAKAEKQRAEHELRQKEAQLRSRDAGLKNTARTQHFREAQRPQEQSKGAHSKFGKESKEAARQKAGGKESRPTPEKSAATPGASHGPKGQQKLTKTQQELANLAKAPRSDSKAVLAKVGGKQLQVLTGTENGKTSTIVTHEGINGEKTVVAAKTDRNGTTTIHGMTRRGDGTLVEWDAKEQNGVPVRETSIRIHGASRDPSAQHRSVESNRLYPSPSPDDSPGRNSDGSRSPTRRDEKAPTTKPETPDRPRQMHPIADNKTPWPRAEHRRDTRPEVRPAEPTDKKERHFGNVPNDHVEGPQDYAVEAEFVRNQDQDSGTLTVRRGLESLTVSVHSGRTTGPSTESVWNAAPPGKYDILQGNDQFRLEMQDSHYGNDEADVSSAWLGVKDLSNIRFHGPGMRGQSAGCLTVGSFNGDTSPQARASWKAVEALIRKGGATGTRTVERYRGHTTMSGLWGKEQLNFFGTLTIRVRRRSGR
ncbi:hypothetical protein [Candidatus Accumulibacter sp. ACC012]|uniref:hypothetical protein n=1 Tax=Candidatus Accumulibacter sp. ACC012 TaxID=2823332 RepID=UPI0025BD7976|nr:hypothetical protein [Candidatus Accumulibacter sp. ACC012]